MNDSLTRLSSNPEGTANISKANPTLIPSTFNKPFPLKTFPLLKSGFRNASEIPAVMETRIVSGDESANRRSEMENEFISVPNSKIV
jgi:hypothetical protein